MESWSCGVVLLTAAGQGQMWPRTQRRRRRRRPRRVGEEGGEAAGEEEGRQPRPRIEKGLLPWYK